MIDYIEKEGYKVLSFFYDKKYSKFEVLCPKNHKKTITWKYFKRGDRCRTCSNKSKKNKIEDIKASFLSENFLVLSDFYENNKQKLKYKCPKKHVGYITWKEWNAGNRCSECWKEELKNGTRKRTIEEVKLQIKELGFEYISGNYENCKSELKIKNKNGKIAKKSLYNLQRSPFIEKDASKYSKPQEEIFDFIKTIYSGKIEYNARNILDKKELDIYIPELNVGIELNGLYWHSEACKKGYRHHTDKYKECKEKNIKFLAIYVDEWYGKQKLIKAMIKNRINIKTKYKKRASNLKLIKLHKNKEYSAFFEKYHLDGHTKASFAYALIDNNKKILSCMSFRKNNKDKCWEIARFATNYDYKIYGNASRLVKNFIKEYKEKLLTYSNNRLSHGNVYKTLGFKEITKTTQPSYWYTDKVTRIFRTKCKRINDPEILEIYPTERDQALAGIFSKIHLGHDKPLYKIYDYGHRKWILNIQ